MGKQLVAFYETASKIGGVEARVQLAKLTSVPSMSAPEEPETPELLERFENALESVRSDFEGKGASLSKAAMEPQGRRDSYGAIYRQVMRDRASFVYNFQLTANRCTETAAEAFRTARASVWLYDLQRTAIECMDLFELASRQHSRGTKLAKGDFPPYFKALETERIIDAADAHTDPRTACFSEPYLRPLGINSMLDVPIWVNRKMVGVLCHEHIGPERKWTGDEVDLATFFASLLAQAIANGR